MSGSELTEEPGEENSGFLIPIEGFIDAVLDAHSLGKTEQLKELFKGLSIPFDEDRGLQALVILQKLPRVPSITAMRLNVGRSKCSDYGCTRS